VLKISDDFADADATLQTRTKNSRIRTSLIKILLLNFSKMEVISPKFAF